MTRPSDAHYDAVTDKSFTSVRCVAHALARTRAPHILGGGWAFFAHGSPVPSADTDLWLARPDKRRVHDATKAECGLDEPDGYIETLPLDGRFHLVPVRQQDQGRTLSFDPRRLLADAKPLPFRVLDESITLNVPGLISLGVTKLGAFRGRRLAWEARTRAATMAQLLGPHKELVYRRTEQYWYRKAGKDLYDLAFASHRVGMDRMLRLAQSHRLRDVYAEALENVPKPLAVLAADIAARSPQTPVDNALFGR